MQPPPLIVDEARRLATLQSLGVLDSDAEESFDALVACVAELTDCPMAALSLVDAERQWFKAVHGHAIGAPRESPRALSFCGHAIAGAGRFEVPDATQDPRFADNPFVTGPPHVRLYAAQPLSLNGVNVGTLYVIDTLARSLSTAQHAALARMARVAIALLQGRSRAALLDDERSRLIDFARACGDWMWETDAALRYTWVSGTFEALTGAASVTLKGQLVEDAPLLDGLGQPLADGQSFRDLLRQHQAFSRVITDKASARGTLQISRSAVPRFDAQGRFAGYRGTARDVSARITNERQTHSQARLLRKLSAQVPGVIFQFHLQPDGHIHYSYASDASRDLFGPSLPPPGEIGHATGLLHSVHPDDDEGFMRSLIDAGLTLTPWQREYRVRDEHGDVRWLETRATPELHPDGGTLWHGFTADVTARKEIELALRSSDERWDMAASAAGIGIAQFNLHNGLVTFDPRACVNHGLSFPQPHFTLADWVASIHPDDRAFAEAAVQQALSKLGKLDSRYRLVLPDGRERTLEILARCTFNDGRVDGMVGTCRDVTQQAVHEQLQRDKEAAERTSRAKSEFLSRVSHELRTPLNGILGFAQLMAIDRIQPLASEQARRLDSVLRAGRHLLELINDMLKLARIEQEDFSLQALPVDVGATLNDCLALIQPLADSTGMQLMPRPTQSLWAIGDPRAVEQVLLNLLSNAIKYNRPGGAVRIAFDTSDGWARVVIRDDGEGLTPEQQAHLFQPFHRLGAEHRRVEGTGLGLVIALELATAMKGGLALHSEPGIGSTFTFSLPASTAPPVDAQAPVAMALPLPPSASPRRRVLYIEDEPLNVLLLQEMFKARPQWELQIAADGQTGLVSAKASHHDLLLIDMNLPDMNGLQLIEALRRDPATHGLQCIALSADAMQTQIDAAMAAGFDGYWTKPINIAQMLIGLGEVLNVPSHCTR